MELRNCIKRETISGPFADRKRSLRPHTRQICPRESGSFRWNTVTERMDRTWMSVRCILRSFAARHLNI